MNACLKVLIGMNFYRFVFYNLFQTQGMNAFCFRICVQMDCAKTLTVVSCANAIEVLL